MSGPKIKFALDMAHTYPRNASHGYTEALIRVIVKLPKQHGDYLDYETSADIAKERFDWIDGNDETDGRRRAAGWMAEGLARVLRTVWGQVNPPYPPTEKYQQYLEKTFPLLTKGEIRYMLLGGRDNSIRILAERYRMPLEDATTKIDEAFVACQS